MAACRQWLALCSLLLAGCHATNINIAWMAVAPFTYVFNASTSLGALKYAMDEIENNASLLPGDTFNVVWKDSHCDSKLAVGRMFEFLENSSFHLDFFLGPICSGAMAPVAQLASYLNIPVLGWISSDPPLADKTLYSTLIRFLWSINNIGEGIAILCRDAKWKRVAIISTEGGDYGVLAEGVRDVLLQDPSDNFLVQRWVSGMQLGPSQDDIRAAYSLVKDEARIIILVVPEDELRDWAKGAYDSKMADGDYVFIYTNQKTPDEKLFNWIVSRQFWQLGDSWDKDVKKAYDNFILVFAKTLDFKKTNSYLEEFHQSAMLWTNPPVPPAQPDFYSLFLYDAMKVYARFATEIGATSNGKKLFDAAKNSITKGGATGDIILTDTCDRIPDYRFFDIGVSDTFDVAAETSSSLNGTKITRKVKFITDFIWGDGTKGLENAPPDVPKCGFDGELCKTKNYTIYWVPVLVIVIVIGIILVIYFVHRKLKYEQDLNSLRWKLNYDDLIVYMGGKAPGSQMNVRTKSQQMMKSRNSVGDSLAGEQLFITVANYKGTMVAIRKVRKSQGIKLERELLQEMKRMTEVKSAHLNTFIGACIDTNKPICCVWEYCTKGSLQDVIFNDSIKLDDMFKFSISIDILKGLEYLHESSLRVHGQLKSSNVVVDNRWTCKLTDFGMVKFCEGEEPDPEQSEHAKYTRLFWTPPEALREAAGEGNGLEGIADRCRCSNNLGDIYSVSIIIKETFCRNSPYQEHEDILTPKEIVEKVFVVADDEVFRPDLSDLDKSVEAKEVAPRLKSFIEQCWSEQVADRLTASAAVKSLTKINPFKKSNVVDNMMVMMENYSNQLEEIVSERTIELQEEQKKTEDLLFKMLPKSVADDLKHGKAVEAESFDAVTILFSDIPGFSELAAECTPLQVVDILNGIYSLMDETINNHDVYKVETVGDVYVLVSGLPLRNGDRHVMEVVNCAMDLISAILTFRVPHKPTHKLPLRIGINTGPIVSGVVGLTNPRYCLFGDTMNTASRMESNGKPLRIHLSPAAYKALNKFSGYLVADRGEIPVKGKGMMNTFWLVGKEQYKGRLPDYRSELLADQPPPNFLPPTSGKKTSQTKVPRPSAESGFSEMNSDSRKSSTMSNGGPTQRRAGITEPPPLIEIDPPTSYQVNNGLPSVNVT